MKKPTVAVIFGSRSTEHDISILTALASVIKPLELSQKYAVVPVYIAKDGRWYSDPKLKDINLFTSGNLDAFLAKQPSVSVTLGGGLTLVKGSGWRAQAIKVDVAFPATHGTHGEDGELMGLLEMADVPYVGCGMTASVLAMDKVLAKVMAQAQGIPVTKFQAFTSREYAAHGEDICKKINADLRYPLFVKPAHLGSSIGISRVTDKKELANAIEVALHYDDKALVEEGVQNLVEVTLPIMGNETPQPALLEQPLLSAEDFFDFDTKYLHGGKKSKGAKSSKQAAQGYSRIPADLSPALSERAQALALHVYRALGCSGLARVDMLVDVKAEDVYFNEVNPLPGSLYAHNWRQAGVSNVDLVLKLIGFAQARHAARQAQTTSFSTSYLQQFK